MKRLLWKILNRIKCFYDKGRITDYQKKITGTQYRLNNEVIMQFPEHISIGKGSYINGGHIFASENATITIGDNCLISYNVHIRTDMHNYESKQHLINSQGRREKSIIIGNDVWIGYGAQILSGITIADGCVIAAGAVVTKDTVKYGVYAGIPARLIKYRES